jgi:hypothetical protein
MLQDRYRCKFALAKNGFSRAIRVFKGSPVVRRVADASRARFLGRISRDVRRNRLFRTNAVAAPPRNAGFFHPLPKMLSEITRRTLRKRETFDTEKTPLKYIGGFRPELLAAGRLVGDHSTTQRE